MLHFCQSSPMLLNVLFDYLKSSWYLVDLCWHTWSGPEITRDLIQLLQKRLDDAVLNEIILTLSRNPMFKLSPEDVQVRYAWERGLWVEVLKYLFSTSTYTSRLRRSAGWFQISWWSSPLICSGVLTAHIAGAAGLERRSLSRIIIRMAHGDLLRTVSDRV